MSTELEDAKEFIETAEQFTEKEYETQTPVKNKRAQKAEEPSANNGPGVPTQYALYGEGYAATTPTVRTLPPGCYDIFSDSKCVYAVPALKPSGLLLELPEMKSDEIIKIAENFWNSETDYKDGNEFVIGGARFSAGLLIYGPPGSGKSCVIKIISNKLVERGGTVFHASVHPSTVVAFLNDFAKIEKNRKSIVILEDIDALIKNYGESSYLEMLDSAKTIDNVLFIATTNYPDLLDPRIYNRPGRLSHIIKVGLPTAKAREAYLKAILKDHREVEYIVDNTEGFTIDHLTALLNARYREKKELKSEIARLRALFKVPKSDRKAIGIGVDRE